MNSKNTLAWFVIAVALLAFIFVYEFLQRPAKTESQELLPGFNPSALTSIQIFPNNAAEIAVEPTNGEWLMTGPVLYPAQKEAIDGLVHVLKKTTVAMRISSVANEADYGFKTPVTIVMQSGDDRREILVGNRTAPGDQVFLRLVGSDGTFVTDAGWLQFLPQSAADWRDTALVGGEGNYDSITLTNGAKIIELHADPTNHLWQMTRPLVARANTDYIVKGLQQLQTARVSQFVTDNSNADLTTFGLQPADLDLWLGHGSNFTSAVHFGKTTTNDSSQIFAKREHWNAIVTTTKEPVSPWYATVNDFRDPYLVELTAPVAEIELIGPDTNHFVLQRLDTNTWTIPTEKFPVDTPTVQDLIQVLAGLRVSGFVKDVVTPADLPVYGLSKPFSQIILRSAAGNTNAVIARLMFGIGDATNEVFVRRTDEDFIYAVPLEDFKKLPEGADWVFRDRTIWNFSETNVAQVTIRQSGKTWQLVRNGINQWSLSAGQGVINAPGVEETVHDLGRLYAYLWVSRGVGVKKQADYGLKPGNLSMTVTLKNGQSSTVDFGFSSGNTALATVTLDGEQWAFIFPPDIYQLVSAYLVISPAVP